MAQERQDVVLDKEYARDEGQQHVEHVGSGIDDAQRRAVGNGDVFEQIARHMGNQQQGGQQHVAPPRTGQHEADERGCTERQHDIGQEEPPCPVVAVVDGGDIEQQGEQAAGIEQGVGDAGKGDEQQEYHPEIGHERQGAPCVVHAALPLAIDAGESVAAEEYINRYASGCNAREGKGQRFAAKEGQQAMCQRLKVGVAEQV